MQSEILRKSFHLSASIIPVLYLLFNEGFLFYVLVPISILVILFDYARLHNENLKQIFTRLFFKILREHEIGTKDENPKLCGASWMFLAASLSFLIFKKEISITAFFILIISDSAASLVGKSFESKKFFEKTFAGSLAFFISALIVVVFSGIYFDEGFFFYFFGFFAAACTTIIEARPNLLKVDDNFSIPISFCVILSFFDILWN